MSADQSPASPSSASRSSATASLRLATRAHFEARTYLEGDDIVRAARGADACRCCPKHRALSRRWMPPVRGGRIGIALAMTEPSRLVDLRLLRRADGDDRGIACSPRRCRSTRSTSARTARRGDHHLPRTVTRTWRPVRAGPPHRRGLRGAWTLLTLDLHANISERMVQSIDSVCSAGQHQPAYGHAASAARRPPARSASCSPATRTERAFVRLRRSCRRR